MIKYRPVDLEKCAEKRGIYALELGGSEVLYGPGLEFLHLC